MAFTKGSKHSPETKAKMSKAHLGVPHSEERKKKLSEANKGKVRVQAYERVCVCGKPFRSGASNARFCSLACGRAARGHGIRHKPEFRSFSQMCAICGRKDDLVGDHDHKSGAPRGLLCRNCNLAIGNLRDRPALLRSAASYLERAIAKTAGQKIIYLSGPISGIDGGNLALFEQVAAIYREQGYCIVNPHEICPDAKDWNDAMRRDIAVLVTCDEILLLPGWENSRGATLERHIALKLEMGVRYHQHPRNES